MITGGVTVDETAVVGPTVASYFSAFSPVPAWDDVCRWPPDVFALANLVLDHTEAYRFAVAPPVGRRWPPVPGWKEHVVAAGHAWRETAAHPKSDPPADVRCLWNVVTDHLDTPLVELREGRAPDVCETLLTLHAIADEACSTLADDSAAAEPGFEHRARELLDRHGSLSRVHPARVRVTPKTHFAARGITIRSLSRHLALNYESIDLGWRRVAPVRRSGSDRSAYNLVLLPWPLEVRASAFRPVEGPLENMDRDRYGFFEFDPREPVDLGLIEGVVEQAMRHVGHVDAVLLPEDAVEPGDVGPIEDVLASLGVVYLVTGVHQRAPVGGLGRNYAHLGARTSDGWVHFQQDKHHRWCLDAAQIRQYHLSQILDPAKLWWEAIDLPLRTVQIIDLGGGTTVAPLICEDLARLDEVADVLRRVGPSLVITLLLDGPQLPQRWACRYATVLADEPGSTVLTLTSSGMAARSRPAGKSRSRAVAVWSEPGAALRPLELAPGARGILLSASVDAKTVWTADGRRHEGNTPFVTLRSVTQLRTPRTKGKLR